jgi:hypothetical protein
VLLGLAAAKGARRDRLVEAATVLAAGALVIAPWVAYASARSDRAGSGRRDRRADAGSSGRTCRATGDGPASSGRSPPRPGRGFPSAGAERHAVPGAAVMETVRARRPDLSYRTRSAPKRSPTCAATPWATGRRSSR